MEYCEKNDLIAYKTACLVKKGCYFKKRELILESLAWLKENDNSGLYKSMLLELKGYGLDPDNIEWKEA